MNRGRSSGGLPVADAAPVRSRSEGPVLPRVSSGSGKVAEHSENSGGWGIWNSLKSSVRRSLSFDKLPFQSSKPSIPLTNPTGITAGDGPIMQNKPSIPSPRHKDSFKKNFPSFNNTNNNNNNAAPIMKRSPLGVKGSIERSRSGNTSQASPNKRKSDEWVLGPPAMGSTKNLSAAKKGESSANIHIDMPDFERDRSGSAFTFSARGQRKPPTSRFDRGHLAGAESQEAPPVAKLDIEGPISREPSPTPSMEPAQFQLVAQKLEALERENAEFRRQQNQLVASLRQQGRIVQPQVNRNNKRAAPPSPNHNSSPNSGLPSKRRSLAEAASDALDRHLLADPQAREKHMGIGRGRYNPDDEIALQGVNFMLQDLTDDTDYMTSLASSEPTGTRRPFIRRRAPRPAISSTFLLRN